MGHPRSLLGEGWIALFFGALGILAYALSEAAIEATHQTATWVLALILHVIRDLGIASFVGGIVSLGIERVARKNFQDEINSGIKDIQRSMINAAYIKSYPEEYANSIRDSLTEERFCRINQHVHVSISRTPADIGDLSSESPIIFEQTSSGRIRNISNSPQPWRQRVFLGRDWDVSEPKLLSWTVGDRELSAEEIESSILEKNDLRSLYLFPEEVMIDPGKEIYSYIKIQHVKRARDVTTWSGWFPVVGLHFVLSHPPEFDAFLQLKSRDRGKDQPVVSDGTRVTLEHFGGLVPHSTIELGWRPRTN